MMKVHLHFCEHDMQNWRYGLFENYNHFQDKTSPTFLFAHFQIEKRRYEKIEIELYKIDSRALYDCKIVDILYQQRII